MVIECYTYVRWWIVLIFFGSVIYEQMVWYLPITGIAVNESEETSGQEITVMVNWRVFLSYQILFSIPCWSDNHANTTNPYSNLYTTMYYNLGSLTHDDRAQHCSIAAEEVRKFLSDHLFHIRNSHILVQSLKNFLLFPIYV